MIASKKDVSPSQPTTNDIRNTVKRVSAEGSNISNGLSSVYLHEMCDINPDVDAKKAKFEELYDTNHFCPEEINSAVLISNLPSNCTETELNDHFRHFGTVTMVSILEAKNQGVLKFSNNEMAFDVVRQAADFPMEIRNSTLSLQLAGRHGHLPPINNNATVRESISIDTDYVEDSLVDSNRKIDVDHGYDCPKTVLRVIIGNLLFPVTLDGLHQVFSSYGVVLRIVTFRKSHSYQALIEFKDGIAAHNAKIALDGKSLFNGQNTMRVEYSRMNTLNVRYNNEKSRDFTNQNLPRGEPLSEFSTLDFAQLFNVSSTLSQLRSSIGAMFPISHAYANVLTPTSPVSVGGSTCSTNAYNVPALGLASTAGNALFGVSNLQFPSALVSASVTSVVLVSNLNEKKVTPDALFTLFGVYGNVQRVKVLFNNKSCALIQYSEPVQAQLALHYLDKVVAWDKPIRVSMSRHASVQMPKEGQTDAGLTKDYATSPLHRFKKPGSKNYVNIFPPSSSLHLSNIPLDITEDFLVSAFAMKGFHVASFRFFLKDRRMAIVELNSVQEGVEALVEMHNFQLSENAHLRVSFSKPGA